MITDYEIVTATQVAGLQDRVRARIGEGWQPVGGIALLHEEDSGKEKPHIVFAQAVIRENGSHFRTGDRT